MFNTFEQAASTRLIETEEFTELLSTWKGEPAFFNLNAVPDTDGNWDGAQYPRAVYYTEWNSDPDRLLSGQLYIQIHCTNQDTIQPKKIEEIIKESLSNVFFNTLRGVFCCSWNKSEPFMFGGDTEPIINGMTMEFSVFAFPDQRTYLTPDPIPGIERYIKEVLPEATVINLDEIPDIFIPEVPVFYVRSKGVHNAGKDTYAWRIMNLSAAIHVISPDYSMIRESIGMLMQQLMLDGRIELFQDSDLLITDDHNDVEITYAGSALMDGQFDVTGEFAIYALKPKEGVLRKLNIYEGEINADQEEDIHRLDTYWKE